MSSLHESLKPYSPALISKTFTGVTTVEKALSVEAPSLKCLSKKDGCNEEQVKALIMAHLISLDAFLKQKNGLSTEEIELIADEVMDVYGYMLNFADINVIFRNAKLGKYGELYGQLSCAKVVKWFEDYSNLRCETAYEMNRRADSAMYGVTQGKSEREILSNLGYSIDKDGHMVIDQDKVKERNARIAEKQKKESEERQAKIKKDNDYLRWKLEYLKNGTL